MSTETDFDIPQYEADLKALIKKLCLQQETIQVKQTPCLQIALNIAIRELKKELLEWNESALVNTGHIQINKEYEWQILAEEFKTNQVKL